MKHIICISILSMLSLGLAKGQQVQSSSLVMMNPIMLNPAECGEDGRISALLNYRRQWSGIENAPASYNLWLGYGGIDKMGIGLVVQKQSAGLLDQLKLKGTYAYHLKLSEGKQLSMGLNMGMVQYQFLATDAIVGDSDDEVLMNGNQSLTAFTSDLGFTYSTRQFTLGLSIPQLLNTKMDLESDMAGITLNMHYQVYGMYHIEVQEQLSLYPFLLYKGAQASASGQIDAGVRAVYKKDMGLGLLYRTNFGLQVSVDAKLNDSLQLQYAFGLASGKITEVSSGTHEIGIMFTFK